MVKKSNIDKIFNEQDKDFDFREPKIKSYRKEVKEELKEDLNKRFKKVSKKDLNEVTITNDKLENRSKPYATPHNRIELVKIESGKYKDKYEYRLINSKSGVIENRIIERKAWTVKEHEDYLINKVEQKGFDFKQSYIPEDSEQVKEQETKYETFYRWGILIYRMKGGKRYEIIYQGGDTQAVRKYIPYQRIIADIKQEVLNKTRISLEEWIYLSKVQRNLYIEGGLNYRRFLGDARSKKLPPEYKVILDFEREQYDIEKV